MVNKLDLTCIIFKYFFYYSIIKENKNNKYLFIWQKSILIQEQTQEHFEICYCYNNDNKK